MFIDRLHANRRFKSRNLVSIWRCYNTMVYSGKIKYTPPEFSMKLVPLSLKETTTFCWTCKAVFHEESHFKTKHPSLDHHSRKSLSDIGRTIPSTRAKLLVNVAAMFGNRTSKGMKKPGKVTRSRNNRVNRANSYLEWLKENQTLNRITCATLDNLILARRDLEIGNNLFCCCCSEWVEGRWSAHRILKHQHLNSLEHQVVYLYSNRLKAHMMKEVLFCRSQDIDNGEIRKFIKFLTRSHFPLSDHKDNLTQNGGKEKKVKWFASVKTKKIINSKFTIRWNNLVAEYKKPFMGTLLVRAYKNFRKEYGRKDLRGFADHKKYRLAQLIANRNLRKELYRFNPPANDACNFIHIPGDKVGHVAFAHFKAIDQAVVVYDGDAVVKDAGFSWYMTEALLALHGNAGGSLRGGYSRAFSTQLDTWSCAYRAMYACLGVMNGQDPAEFTVQLEQMFRFMKYAVEDPKKLKEFKLHQLWELIAKKKKNFSRKLINYQYLIDKRNV